MKEQHGRIGNLPANINIMNPVPNKDAKTITGLVRKNGKVSGYELSDGRVLSKREGVALAKQGHTSRMFTVQGFPLSRQVVAAKKASRQLGHQAQTIWELCVKRSAARGEVG